MKLLSVRELPPYTRARLGGLVAVHAVKFLGKLGVSESDVRTRKEWWREVREEVRSKRGSVGGVVLVALRHVVCVCVCVCVCVLPGSLCIQSE